ncbi:hypothetical protein CO671_00850 [Rhizobium sp. M10]|nr:hypothetical protein CO671_00850 [Rhizobium sp. M10]
MPPRMAEAKFRTSSREVTGDHRLVGKSNPRLFKDNVDGSPEASLVQAEAYRDVVISALPPKTNHEQAACPHMLSRDRCDLANPGLAHR